METFQMHMRAIVHRCEKVHGYINDISDFISHESSGARIGFLRGNDTFPDKALGAGMDFRRGNDTFPDSDIFPDKLSGAGMNFRRGSDKFLDNKATRSFLVGTKRLVGLFVQCARPRVTGPNLWGQIHILSESGHGAGLISNSPGCRMIKGLGCGHRE